MVNVMLITVIDDSTGTIKGSTHGVDILIGRDDYIEGILKMSNRYS